MPLHSWALSIYFPTDLINIITSYLFSAQNDRFSNGDISEPITKFVLKSPSVRYLIFIIRRVHVRLIVADGAGNSQVCTSGTKVVL